jgi:hypothetical protein
MLTNTISAFMYNPITPFEIKLANCFMCRPRPPFYLLLPLLPCLCTLRLPAQTSVVTWHNDNARLGLNTNETILTPVNVNQNGFGRIFSHSVDGPVYAQPLYVPNVTVPGKGVHNVVFVATMHDSVYAFDADTQSGSNAAPLWHTSFINPSAGIVPATTLDAVDSPGQDCRTFSGEIGICGTPVIDLSSQTLYVLARTKEPGTGGGLVQFQRLHALNISNGTEKASSPVAVQASVNGSGDGSSGNIVQFNPAREMQRSALLLSGGVVYLAWASYCDLPPYHGWLIGYDAQTLQQVSVFNATPNGRDGGIWMGGGGPAAAADGSIYVVTGNGTFDATGTPSNFGDSFVKLSPSQSGLSVADYFAPANQAFLDASDIDLGSGGALVLPDSVGSFAHPRLLVGCGKDGQIFLLDRDNLGHFNSAGDTQVVQKMPVYSTQTGQPYFFGCPAFFNDQLYFQCVGQSLRAFAITNGTLSPTPISQSSDIVTFRGAIPCVSANSSCNGVVWQLTPAPQLGVQALHAYAADDLSHKLYDSYLSALAGLPDRVGFVKFAVPTIANGKVYVGGTAELAVFGLRNYIWSTSRNVAANSLHIVYSGPDGMNNILQSSVDLVTWTDLGPGTPTGDGKFSYDDPIGANSAKFYRVHSQ